MFGKQRQNWENCGGCVTDPNLQRDPRHEIPTQDNMAEWNCNLIDLVIVYPEAVRTSAGSTTLEADILSAVASGQSCFRNSQVNIIARLVHMEEVSYTRLVF